MEVDVSSGTCVTHGCHEIDMNFFDYGRYEPISRNQQKLHQWEPSSKLHTFIQNYIRYAIFVDHTYMFISVS